MPTTNITLMKLILFVVMIFSSLLLLPILIYHFICIFEQKIIDILQQFTGFLIIKNKYCYYLYNNHYKLVTVLLYYNKIFIVHLF